MGAPDLTEVENVDINGRLKLYAYLNYGGYCEEAFRFYEEHLGGNDHQDDDPRANSRIRTPFLSSSAA